MDPITGTAIAEATKRLSSAAQAPVFGTKTTIIETKKNGTVIVTEDSFQIRAWEVGVLGAVASAIALFYSFQLAEKETGSRNPIMVYLDPLGIFAE